MTPSQGIFHPRRLGHVNLFVSDLDRALAFYNEVVGLEVVYVRPPVAAGFFSNGNTHHDIGVVAYRGRPTLPQRAGLNHLGFEVEHEADLVASYGVARDAGAEIQRAADHVIARAVYLGDPDGNQVEIYADSVKDWRAARNGVVNHPTIVWQPGEETPSTARNYTPNPEIRRVETAVFHPRRATHAALVVEDYPAAVRYYTEMVGLRPLAGGAAAPFCLLAGSIGEQSLSLFPTAPGRAPGLHHVGFLAWDEADLEASKQKALAGGLQIEADVAQAGRRAVHLRDPDGIRLQFYVDRPAGPAALADAAGDLALYLA